MTPNPSGAQQNAAISDITNGQYCNPQSSMPSYCSGTSTGTLTMSGIAPGQDIELFSSPNPGWNWVSYTAQSGLTSIGGCGADNCYEYSVSGSASVSTNYALPTAIDNGACGGNNGYNYPNGANPSICDYGIGEYCGYKYYDCITPTDNTNDCYFVFDNTGDVFPRTDYAPVSLSNACGSYTKYNTTGSENGS
jgi:hypothetical protein